MAIRERVEAVVVWGRRWDLKTHDKDMMEAWVRAGERYTATVAGWRVTCGRRREQSQGPWATYTAV